MKKEFTGATSQQIHNSVQNTIRVFNEYRLDKKSPIAGVYKIWSSAGDLIFYNLQYFDIEGGTQLSVMGAKAIGGEMTDAFGVENFFERLEQVHNGRIALTPEVVNRDVYKGDQGTLAIIWVIRAVVALAAIILGLKALLR